MIKRRILIVILVLSIYIVGCSPSESAIHTAIANTEAAHPSPTIQIPTQEPTTTPTPEPDLSCPEKGVLSYIAEMESILDEWDDTVSRAGVTARIALSPVFGELQSLRRRVEGLKVPLCGEIVSEYYIIAMNLTISGYDAFMLERDDKFVTNLLNIADDAYEFAKSWFEIFREDPEGFYIEFNKIENQLAIKKEEAQPLELEPETWKEYPIPQSKFIISIPKTWQTDLGNSIIDIHRFKEKGRGIELLCSFVKDRTDIKTDSGRSYEFKKTLEVRYLTKLLIFDSFVDYIGENKVFFIRYLHVYFDVELNEIGSVIQLPDDDLVECIASIGEGGFREEEINVIKTIFGSIKKTP